MLEQMITAFEDEEEEVVVSRRRIPNRIAPRYPRDLHRICNAKYVEHRVETNAFSYQMDNVDYDEISIPTTYTTASKPTASLEDGYCALLLAIFGGAIHDRNGRIVKGIRRYTNDAQVCLDVIYGKDSLHVHNSTVCTDDEFWPYHDYKFSIQDWDVCLRDAVRLENLL